MKFLFVFFVFAFLELSQCNHHEGHVDHAEYKHGEQGHAEHAGPNHGNHGDHSHESHHEHDHGNSHDHPHSDHHKVKVDHIQLNNGLHMPAIGLGTSVKGGSKPHEVQHNVEAAIDAGYRFIDTAENYETEDQVGEAIKKKIHDGVVKREDLFVTTKLWNDHHRRDLVVPALKESLKQLGLDYVDLYLIHWPVEDFKNFTFGETDYVDTWYGMEECQKLGLAKSIGLSNFNEEQITRVLSKATVKPAALEIEVNPTNSQKKLINFCKEKNIAVIGYAPLGFLPEAKKRPDALPPAIDDPILTSIAEKYKKSTTQVVLRYLVDCGVVPIPKSGNPARLQQNIDIFDFHLSKEDAHQIDHFNKDHRLIDVPEWRPHKYYPFGKQ